MENIVNWKSDQNGKYFGMQNFGETPPFAAARVVGWGGCSPGWGNLMAGIIRGAFKFLAITTIAASAYAVYERDRVKPAATDATATVAPPVADQKPPKSKAAPRVDQSAAKQAKRREIIRKLIGERVFTKVDVPGYLPRLYVGPRFYSLDFDDKKSFVSVVYALYLDGSDDYASVRIFDGRSNKEIGSFSVVSGLELR